MHVPLIIPVVLFKPKKNLLDANMHVNNSALGDDGQTMNKCKSNCSFRYLNFFDRIQRNVTLWPEEQPQECPLPLGLR